MEKEGNGSRHEVTRALPLQLHQGDPSPGTRASSPLWGSQAGASCTHTGELGHVGKGLLAKTPGCGHVGRLPPGQGWCAHICLNLKPHPRGRRGGSFKAGGQFYKTLGGGPSLHLQAQFSQPHPEAISQEQFSSRLCLQPWVTGKVTHIPSPVLQPQI